MPATHTGGCNSSGPAVLCCQAWGGMEPLGLHRSGEGGREDGAAKGKGLVYQRALGTFISPSLAASAQHRWDGVTITSLSPIHEVPARDVV